MKRCMIALSLLLLTGCVAGQQIRLGELSPVTPQRPLHTTVAVSVDDPGQQKAVRDFARELGLTFEILQDPTHRIEKIYQTTGVPETFVLGRDGVIRKKIIGATDWSSQGTRALVAQLLAEK